jgi:GNAT superfamily N-acetyltransferase
MAAAGSDPVGAPHVRRSSAPAGAAGCAAIVASLPDHFDEHAVRRVREDVAAHGASLLVAGRLVVSFVVVERRGPAAEILWMATRPELRRRGHGGRLLGHVLDALEADGVRIVEVKTLDASAAYAPYEATRVFWERSGFVHVDTIDPYPGWQPGNPCAIYVRGCSCARPRGSPTR